MGGFVARAAVVHPHLRKFSVETVLTLSTPHQWAWWFLLRHAFFISHPVISYLWDFLTFSRSPPVALQPSLGHYYAHVNEEWKKGYEPHTSRSGHYVSGPELSRVVVVSISGGIHDYQVFLLPSYLDSFNGNSDYLFGKVELPS